MPGGHQSISLCAKNAQWAAATPIQEDCASGVPKLLSRDGNSGCVLRIGPAAAVQPDLTVHEAHNAVLAGSAGPTWLSALLRAGWRQLENVTHGFGKPGVPM